MIEEIKSIRYKVNSEIFDSKEEAERFEEIHEVFKNLKELDLDCKDCKDKKCFIEKEMIFNTYRLCGCNFCQFGNAFCASVIFNYDILKKIFKG